MEEKEARSEALRVSESYPIYIEVTHVIIWLFI